MPRRALNPAGGRTLCARGGWRRRGCRYGRRALRLIALVVSLVSAPTARAATITVNSFTDAVADDGFCTVREAIAAANNDVSIRQMPGECVVGDGADIIDLPAGIYTLKAIDNEAFGPSGLPSINSNITINGLGASLTRDPTAPPFRVLLVAVGGTLTLNDLTIGGGVAVGPQRHP